MAQVGGGVPKVLLLRWRRRRLCLVPEVLLQIRIVWDVPLVGLVMVMLLLTRLLHGVRIAVRGVGASDAATGTARVLVILVEPVADAPVVDGDGLVVLEDVGRRRRRRRRGGISTRHDATFLEERRREAFSFLEYVVVVGGGAFLEDALASLSWRLS